MSSNNQIRNVAIVGASGNVGGSTLKHLLDTNRRFNVTAVTRPDSTATLPSHPSLTVKQAAYDDNEALEKAFKGQDVVMFALHAFAGGREGPMIEAAAKAGVRWIIPNEYAGDGSNKDMVDNVPVFQPKRAIREHVEKLSQTYEGLKWIGVVTNPFTEMCLQRKLFGFDHDAKTATIYPDAGVFNTSTMNQIGLGISRLLALPISDEKNPRASLQHYANDFVYISSFSVTQTKLLEATQRVTGTSKQDWKIDDSKTVKGWIEGCREGMKNGDPKAGWGLTFAYYIGEGLGGDYESKAREDRKVLNLPQEDLDEAVKHAIAGGNLPKVI